MKRLLLGALYLLAAGCRSAPPPPPPSGFIWLELSPATASVLVDDRPLLRQGGSAARFSVPAGPHRIEVYAPGYFRAYKDAAVIAAAQTKLAVSLRADPDSADGNEAAAATSESVRPLGPRPTHPDVP